MSSCDFAYELGDILRDKVSGLTGVVMVRAEYSTGCHHYGLSPKDVTKDGQLHEWEWIDQSRLELVKSKAVVFRNEDEPVRSGAFPSGPGR